MNLFSAVSGRARANADVGRWPQVAGPKVAGSKVAGAAGWFNPWTVYLGAILLFWRQFAALFPGPNGMIGHDYALFLPNLLAGYFWFQRNGLTAIPWFTPAFCGGFPFYPDPNAPWFSVPQFLTFALGPLAAVQATALIFATIGYFSAYALLRKALACSREAAIFGAALFMFNGLFMARMLIGHLTFHAFMVVPAIAAAATWSRGEAESGHAFALRLSASGACWALIVEAGMLHAIAPIFLSVAVVVLVAGIVDGVIWTRLFVLVGGTVAGILLSLTKALSVLFLLRQLPRDLYPLAGAPDIFLLSRSAFAAVFLRPVENSGALLVNTHWLLERHEWEFGVGPVACLMILLGATAFLSRLPWRSFTIFRVALGLVILLILATPLAVNYYSPDWTAFLKTIPGIRNSSNLIRWFSTYILVSVVLAAYGFDAVVARVPVARSQAPAVLALLLAASVAWQVSDDKSYYARQSYDPKPVETAYRDARNAVGPPITTIVSPRTASDPGATPLGRNDELVSGGSQLVCYQPLFGYSLEGFPMGRLRPGSPFWFVNQSLNLKDPACYVFPAANQCLPGDHFPISRRADAWRFLNYEPYSFNMPWIMKAAEIVNVGACLVCLAIFAFSALSFMKRSIESV